MKQSVILALAVALCLCSLVCCVAVEEGSTVASLRKSRTSRGYRGYRVTKARRSVVKTRGHVTVKSKRSAAKTRGYNAGYLKGWQAGFNKIINMFDSTVKIARRVKARLPLKSKRWRRKNGKARKRKSKKKKNKRRAKRKGRKLGKKRKARRCRIKGTLTKKFRGRRWVLVRHVASSYKKWHPAKDKLKGTAVYGHYSKNPKSSHTFSVKYSHIPFKQFMFSTGDMKHWLITSKAAATTKAGFSKQTILQSSISNKPYKALWVNRVGVSEDPWISERDHFYGGHHQSHDSETHSMLYGENAYPGWNYYRNNHAGANVWISC